VNTVHLKMSAINNVKKYTADKEVWHEFFR